jgi:hypothetical protein
MRADLDARWDSDRLRAALSTARPVRLSRSVLWPLQRAFFEHLGPLAWTEGGVPRGITHTPALAAAYARVIAAFLHDLEIAAASNGPPLDPEEPLYIVELGAGPGRFGPQLLRRLRRAFQGLGAGVPRPVLVLTDLSEQNLAHWRSNRRLEPYFKAGLLDLGRFDVGRDERLELERKGTVLAAGTVRNPLVVLANYVFDSVPQDAFAFGEGALDELLARCSLAEPGLDVERPRGLESLDVAFSRRRASLPYYGDPDWDFILEGWAREIDEGAALFPIDALHAVRAFERASGGRLLLIVGDKGDPESDALPGLTEPSLVFHGSVSLPVSFRAIARYVERRGGFALELEPRSPFFGASVYAMGMNREALTHMSGACALPAGSRTEARASGRAGVAPRGTTLELEAGS